jgi:hypothetical protein
LALVATARVALNVAASARTAARCSFASARAAA